MPLSGIGFGEMLLIAMLVLIVFGPRRLPEITRTLGKAVREFKRGMNEIQRELEVADRESRWSSPAARAGTPAGTSTPTIAAPAVAGTASVSESSAPEGSPEDEGAGSAGPESDAAADAHDAETVAPPVSTPGYADPADEFIDPWSTDSGSVRASQPRPSSEPVIAPPPAEDGPDAAGSGDHDGLAPKDTDVEAGPER